MKNIHLLPTVNGSYGCIIPIKEAFAMGRTNATIKDFNTKFKNK